MAQIGWTGGGSGVWGAGANWSGGRMPGLGDDVEVAGAGVVLQGPGGVSHSLTVTGDVALQGGVLTGELRLGGTLSVDSNSAVEVGFAGGAASSVLSVDPGRVLTGMGTLAVSGGVRDDGTLEARGGTLSVVGTVAGGGVMRVGLGATLALEGVGAAPSTAGVSFLGPGGTLAVRTTTYFDGTQLASGLTEAGVVSGFVQWDTIRYEGGALTGASYQAGANGLGTLTLLDGTAVLGSLTLQGDYSGSVFQVTGDGAGGSVVTLTGPPGGSGVVPSNGAAGTHAFALAAGGSWSTAGNWVDVTAGGGPAAISPGAYDTATIGGPSDGTSVAVSGVGNATALQVTGGAELDGAFNVGVLGVGVPTVLGVLDLGDGTAMTVGQAGIVNGSIHLDGTATLTVGGTLALGGGVVAGTALDVEGTAAVQATGGLVLAAGSANLVVVAGTGTLEVGGVGGVQAGHLAVDAGLVLQGAGLVSAPAGIDDAGTITAQGGTLSLLGPVTGLGNLVVGAGATLSLGGGGASTATVGFAGPGGTLGVTTAAEGGLTAAGVITGFAPGDTIHYSGSVAATGVSFQPGAGGVGTLTLTGAGGAVIGSLLLAGSTGGDVFRVAAAGNGWDITAAALPVSPDPLFDVAYYLAQNPDVAAAGVDPYQHYLTIGWKEGRSPSALFNTTYYENQNPDVKAAGVNPLLHYETNGWHEGRDPSLGFSTTGYLNANPDVKAAGIDPLQHYEANGQFEGRAIYAATPHATGPQNPLVDAAYVYAHNPAVAAAGLDATAWFNSVGWQQGADPDAEFSTTYYENQNPDVKAAGVNPLLHYETNGWHEGRDPSLVFSDAKYLAANPDVAAAGGDPLQHYVVAGQFEGRAIYAATPHTTGPQNPLVDAAYVYAERPDVAAAGLDATAWFNSVGWQQGANPDAEFDTNYYLTQNPDVKAAGVNPLLHFETNGWHEGRDPSLLFSDAKYLAANPDVAAAGIDPLDHYEAHGQSEGRATFLTGGTAAADPLVNPAFYDPQLGASLVPTGPGAAQQAAWSYDTSGWQRGLSPDPLFDTNYYLAHNPDVAAAHVDPLAHYEAIGWKEGRDPSAAFSTSKYLAAYGDVRAAAVDPLLHYVQFGQGEGRQAFAV